MTSYRVEDVADVDPALHHPCVHRGARVGPVIGSVPGQMGPNDGSTGRYGGGFGVTARYWPYGFKYEGVGSVHDVAELDVVRGAPVSLRTRSLPGTHGQCAPRGHPDGCSPGLSRKKTGIRLCHMNMDIPLYIILFIGWTVHN